MIRYAAALILLSLPAMAGDPNLDERIARGTLLSICKSVYKTVERIATCDRITQRHYNLEQRYFPGEPQKVANKVLEDLFPSAPENERRRLETIAKGSDYTGPPPSELYEAMR